jgi:hypothetical protein
VFRFRNSNHIGQPRRVGKGALFAPCPRGSPAWHAPLCPPTFDRLHGIAALMGNRAIAVNRRGRRVGGARGVFRGFALGVEIAGNSCLSCLDDLPPWSFARTGRARPAGWLIRWAAAMARASSRPEKRLREIMQAGPPRRKPPGRPRCQRGKSYSGPIASAGKRNNQTYDGKQMTPESGAILSVRGHAQLYSWLWSRVKLHHSEHPERDEGHKHSELNHDEGRL